MSEVKVNKISPRTNCGTVTLGDSGDTFSIPAGVTLTNSGTATGFGPTGAVSWNTTKITANPNPAVSGVGYFADTSSAAFTVTLPAAPSAGDIVALSDYTGTWGANNITVGRNSSNINGAASDLILNTDNTTATLIYVDGTEGWRVIDTGSLSEVNIIPEYVAATGGTVTCCGDYKIHTFTGPGTFTVSAVGNPAGSTTVDYLVVAGGGGAGTQGGGGGGAGGLIFSSSTYTAPPTSAPRAGSALPVSVQGYPITVGAGGSGASGAQPSPAGPGSSGNNSIFSTITSAAGGGGGRSIYTCGSPDAGLTGGSGGGKGKNLQGCGAAGNTPPVSPSQGNPGGAQLGPQPTGGTGSGGGGGAGAAGGAGSGPGTGPGQPQLNGPGGIGLEINISGSNTYYSGGGGGGSDVGPQPASPAPIYGGLGGQGGGGPGAWMGGSVSDNGTAGTTNTGGGGGGGELESGTISGGNGGSGIVIIRYKFQN
jgi:hypothetical protein